jgi:UDP-galactose transporter B1
MPSNEPELNEKNANGSTNDLHANGSASVKEAVVLEPEVDTPGLTQLLICVLGIYAAL